MTASPLADSLSESIARVVKEQILGDMQFAANLVCLGNETLGYQDRHGGSTLTNSISPLCPGREADGYIGSRASTHRLRKRGILKAYKSGRHNLFLRDRCRRVREMILAGRVSPGLPDTQSMDADVIAELDSGDREWLAKHGGDLTLPDKTASSKPPT